MRYFIPICVGKTWFIVCICKIFKINRTIRRNCIVSIQPSAKINNNFIISKLADYVKEKSHSLIKDVYTIFIKNHKLKFNDTKNFISILKQITKSDFNSRKDIQEMLDKKLK